MRNDQQHSVDGRLKLLKKARALFLEKPFSEMSLRERKAIAGTYGSKEPKLDNLDWGWFGSMIGAGVFKSLEHFQSDRNH